MVDTERKIWNLGLYIAEKEHFIGSFEENLIKKMPTTFFYAFL